MVSSSTSQTAHRMNRSQVPFTPRRPPSQAASADGIAGSSIPSSVSRYPTIARAQTPINGSALSAPKKIKAAVSVESRVRSTAGAAPSVSRSKTPTSLDVPATPTRRRVESTHSRSRSRSTTPIPPSSPRPGTPKRSHSRADLIDCAMESEMDVSRVDPEQVLVDSENVEVDLSVEIDERELRTLEYGKEDKVLVSVRVRPTTSTMAWAVNTTERTLKLLPEFTKTNANQPNGFHYDEVLTGTPNKPIYNAAARSHVYAAMDGYNSVIFAYGQTASGKTFTLSGNDEEPGIIPRAMRDVFAYIRQTPSREYLLRCSYLEIYNEAIFDLLAPTTSSATSTNTVTIQGTGDNVILSPLREEVVTSLKGVKEVLERGYGNRRTATTDWNERSSRSHSVFRVVIESRERGSSDDECATPVVPPTPGGTRLQSRGGRSVQTSVLSLIDLAGSEKATSDKDRTREGRYINTSLLTLGTVIGTLGENAAKRKNDFVPFRNSKLTRMLQPSLSGNARISVICTINPEQGAVAETTSTLLFAQRVKRVQLNAKKKEIVDTEALLQRYRKEIEDLKSRLEEREAEAPVRRRRLSAREQVEETRAMHDLNSRIQQLTKLILTSQTVDDSKGDDSRAPSPSKLDFDLEPYQIQQELLSARRQLESQAMQILSLEAALQSRPPLPADAPETEKDRLIAEQTKTIRELEIVVRGYEDNLGEPLRAVREDVEREWEIKVEEERKKREEKEAWAEELVRQVEKERSMRQKLEEERRALASFVTKFDSLGLNTTRLRQPTLPSLGPTAFMSRRRRSYSLGLPAVPELSDSPSHSALTSPSQSPMKPEIARGVREAPNLLLELTPENSELELDLAEVEVLITGDMSFRDPKKVNVGMADKGRTPRAVLKDKENIAPIS